MFIKNKFIFLICVSFIFNLFSLQEKPFAIIVPSYNNSLWYKKNLDSILFQNYQNYKVIYIDDCSSDNTGNLVLNYVKQKNKLDRFIFIQNDQRSGAGANRYNAIHLCDDEEIVVLVDGDDWLSDKNVLTYLNEIYSKENIWTTYGQFFYLSTNNLSSVKDFPKNVDFRKHKWISKHLRTFYAGIFKKIKLKDFLYKGKFFQVASDLAESFPVLEMARGHIKCLDKGLYVYNDKNVNSDFRINLPAQIACEKVIRNRECYTIQESIASTNNKFINNADILIFSKYPDNLSKLLNSLKQYVIGLSDIKIITEAKVVYEKINQSESEYIILCDDNLEIKDYLDVNRAINFLQNTGALLFDFVNHKNSNCYKNLFFEKILDNLVLKSDFIFACQPKYGTCNINEKNGMMYLVRKSELDCVLNTISFKLNGNCVKSIFNILKSKFDFDEVMLVFGDNKFINK